MTRATVPAWRTTLLVLGVAGLWLLATSGLRIYTMPDEGRYAGVAWEMLRSGDWSVPTLDSLPFFHKPPLFYWLTAISFKLFGVHVWSARLGSWVGAMLAVASLYRFSVRWFDATQARAAVLVLATMPYFFLGAQFANMDMLVAGCISVAVAGFADAVLSMRAGRPHRWALAAGWVGAGLAVLAKGLIGIVLPCATVCLWLLWTHAPRDLARAVPRTLGRLLWGPGPWLFLAVCLPWLVTMQLRYDQFFDYFIVTQHFRRFASTGFNNAQPVWFYLPVVALLTLPWSVMGLLAWWRGAAPADDRSAARRLLIVWAAVVLGFFSLPQSKLIGYVLPSLPPLAALIADALGRWQAATPARRERVTAVLAGLLCVGSVVLVMQRDTKSNQTIAAALSRDAAPTDQLVYLDAYPYDLTLFLKLPQPVTVLSRWSELATQRNDSWREELHDAEHFEPGRVQTWLVDTARYAEVLCRAPVTWVISNDAPALRDAGLPADAFHAQSERLKLWKVARPAQCPADGAAAKTQ